MNRAVTVWKAPGEAAPGLDYAVRLVDRLKEAGYAPTLRSALDGDAFERLDGARHLLTGGAVAVSDETEDNRAVMAHAAELYRRARSGALRLTGICLGAQQLAALHAGVDVVIRSPSGFDIGFAPMRPVRPLWPRLTAFRFHYEEVDDRFWTARGVERLYVSDSSPVEGFRIGATINAVQFHPEFSPEDASRILRASHALCARFGLDPSEVEARDARAATRWNRRAVARLLRKLAG